MPGPGPICSHKYAGRESRMTYARREMRPWSSHGSASEMHPWSSHGSASEMHGQASTTKHGLWYFPGLEPCWHLGGSTWDPLLHISAAPLLRGSRPSKYARGRDLIEAKPASKGAGNAGPPVILLPISAVPLQRGARPSKYVPRAGILKAAKPVSKGAGKAFQICPKYQTCLNRQ